ncbi:MAG: helix-turn-helix domain-containing protein [Flavobacteriia bacterium]
MSKIFIEEEAFHQIISKLEAINEKLNREKATSPLSEVWLDNEEVCRLLHISKRKLQYMRDNQTLAYTRIGSKLYYKSTDVEALLKLHYQPSKS